MSSTATLGCAVFTTAGPRKIDYRETRTGKSACATETYLESTFSAEYLFRADRGFAPAFPHYLVRDGQQISIAHVFRRISQRHHALITFVQLFARGLVTQVHERRA